MCRLPGQERAQGVTIFRASAWCSKACGAATLAALALLLSGVAPASPPAVRVITSPEHAQQELDRGFVRGAFTMRVRRWPDGTPLHVFVLPDSDPVHVQFSRDELGTFPYVLRSIWDRLVFTGTGLAPTQVQSEQEMRDKVLSTPGAIGYVRATPGAGTGVRQETSAYTRGAP